MTHRDLPQAGLGAEVDCCAHGACAKQHDHAGADGFRVELCRQDWRGWRCCYALLAPTEGDSRQAEKDDRQGAHGAFVVSLLLFASRSDQIPKLLYSNDMRVWGGSQRGIGL